MVYISIRSCRVLVELYAYRRQTRSESGARYTTGAGKARRLKMADISGLTPHPEVFTVMPPQPTEKKPGQLPLEKVKEYFEEGFVIIEDFFEEAELEACKNDIIEVVDDLANRLYKAGKITSLYEEYGLFERLIFLEKDFPGATILIMKEGKLTRGIKDLWSKERLLNAIEQLIGPDIMGHPVWNLRTKVPQNEATTVPWHQDIAYLDNDSYSVLQVSAWIPLLDTNRENGCMEMLRRGHRTGAVAKHTCCYGNTWYVMIDEDDMKEKLGVEIEKDKVLVPVPYRGMILFNNMIPHRSLPNVSNTIRWTMDLRWQTPHHPVGFHDLKDGVLMRDSKNPAHKIDWVKFEGIDGDNVENSEKPSEEEEFSTIITGPWMQKWPLVHENRHTRRLTEDHITSWHSKGASLRV